MSMKIEEKFDYLLDLIISTAENKIPHSIKMQNEIKKIRNIQIALTTLTTILLGLKLGEIATSIAFVLSTLASAVSIRYNIKNSTETLYNTSKYCIQLTSLARELQFYMKCANPCEEEKFQEYSNKFFILKKEYEENSIDLLNETSNTSQDTIKNINA